MIKLALHYFIVEQCINVTFARITENFIKPDMTNIKIQQCVDRIRKQFPAINLNSVTVLKYPRAGGKLSRYDDVAHVLDEGKYYRTTTFGELGNVLRS